MLEKAKLMIILISTAFMILLFQNCDGGFDVSEVNQESADAISSGDNTEEGVPPGARLPEEPDSGGNGAGPIINKTRYAQIKPILEKYNCTGCHTDMNSYGDLLFYVVPFNSVNSSLYDSLLVNATVSRRMPVRSNRYLTSSETALLAKWIDDGALN